MGLREWKTAAELAAMFPEHDRLREYPCIVVEPQPKDPPKDVCELLSDFWGATSLHGAVFRKPLGLVFWHCEDCKSPCSPSGMRSHVLPAHGKTQMEVVCSSVRVMRKVEAMS